jgi:hypothetical protein
VSVRKGEMGSPYVSLCTFKVGRGKKWEFPGQLLGEGERIRVKWNPLTCLGRRAKGELENKKLIPSFAISSSAKAKNRRRAALIKNSTYSVTLRFLQLKSERIHTLIWKGGHKVALLLNEV